MAMPVAVILGNGKTRTQFKNILRLKSCGFVVGCNAIYRDYALDRFPDAVVAVDLGMIEELKLQTEYPKENIWIPALDDFYEPKACNPNRPRTNAGVHAIREVAHRMPYINTYVALGFDFMIDDADQSISNIYDGTANYGKHTRANVNDNANRARFLSYVMDNEAPKDCTLYLAYPEKYDLIPVASPKIKTITFETLERAMIP